MRKENTFADQGVQAPGTLRKIYAAVIPAPVRRFLREHDPHYQTAQLLQQQIDVLTAQFRAQQEAAAQQLRESEQNAARAAAEYQAQLKSAAQQLQEKDLQLREKDENTARMATEYQTKLESAAQQLREKESQLQGKDENIARITAEHQTQMESATRQLREKDENTARTAAEYQTKLETAAQQLREKELQLQEKDENIARITAEHQAQMESATRQLREKDENAARMAAEHQAQMELAAQQLQKKEQQLKRQIAYLKRQRDAASPDAGVEPLLPRPSSSKKPVCTICGQPVQYSFSHKVMGRYDVSYFYCANCDHLQTETPYWLTESYNSPLSDSDTGLVWRNEYVRGVVCAALHAFFPPSSEVLEYAGGYGLLTRMLRDAGAKCYWYDKYATNTFARHFEDDKEQHYDLVLAFEALEHFEDPMAELENIFRRGDSLLFSEELLTEPCPKEWWYLCSEHGQHVNFYSLKTLQFIAERFHKKLFFHGSIGLLTDLDITQEKFDEMFAHIPEYEKAFRDSHVPLTREDMENVIEEMKL